MRERILSGTIFKGFGFAARGFGRMIDVIRERSCLPKLYPQTVNVRFAHWYAVYPDITILAHEYGHHEHIFLERCQLYGRSALICRNSQNAHGSWTVELLAEERVRRNHRLKIGDLIAITTWERGPRRPKEPRQTPTGWAL